VRKHPPDFNDFKGLSGLADLIAKSGETTFPISALIADPIAR
jgi:hypothetical protein